MKSEWLTPNFISARSGDEKNEETFVQLNNFYATQANDNN